jgi:hypothetical protein
VISVNSFDADAFCARLKLWLSIIEDRPDLCDCDGMRSVGSQAMSDDGVVVTENERRPQRPDNTAEQDAAETRAQEIIKDLDAGLVTKRSAIKVKHAAKRAIGGHDLGRGLRNML